MKTSKIIEAHHALKELLTLKLPYKVARDIQKLNATIAQEIDIIITQEKAWVHECGGEPNDDGSKITFSDPERAGEYGKWRRDMLDSGVEISLPKCDLSAYVDQITISPSALAALEGIVTFESEG